jgi:hypothetical protein
MQVQFATCEQFLEYQVEQGITAGTFSNFNFTVDPNRTITHNMPVPVNEGGKEVVKYLGVPTVVSDGLIYMSPAVYDCCNFPINVDNTTLGNMSAPCIYCAGMCGTPGDVCYTTASVAGGNTSSTSLIDAVTLSALYGLDWVAVSATYGTALAVTIGVVIWNRFLACPKGRENSCGCRNACENWDIGEDETCGSQVVPSTPHGKGIQYPSAQYSMPLWQEDSRMVLDTSASSSHVNYTPKGGKAGLTSPDKQYYAM